MELIYLIDRTVTYLVKRISGFLTHRTPVPILLWKWMAYGFVLIGSGETLRHFGIEPDIDDSITYFSVVFGGLIFTPVLSPIIGACIRKAHRMIDPENYFNPDKLWGEAYKAWAIFSGAGLGLLFYLSDPSAEYRFIAVWLMFEGFEQLYFRKKGKGSNKGKVMSQALQDLLERCKGWLPKPVPSPSS